MEIEVLDFIEEHEHEYFYLRQRIQDEMALGLAELSCHKLMKNSNFIPLSSLVHDEPHLRAEGSALVSHREAASLSNSPELSRARSRFTKALHSIVRLATLRQEFHSLLLTRPESK